MRICMIHNEYGRPSGEEMVVERTCALLEDNGHEVIRFTRSSAEIPRMFFGRTRAFFSGIHSRSSARAVRKLLAEKRPDLVHVNNLFPLISPSVLAECRKAGVPVVMTVHNFRLTCPSGLHMTDGSVCNECLGGREYRCLARNCEGKRLKSLGYAIRSFAARKRRAFLSNVTIYLALTDFQRRLLVAEGFPDDRIVVVPNMARVAPEADASPPGDYVAYVGRVSPEKGVPVLLDAARQCPEIPFRAAGALDRMPELASQAPGNFEFLGHLDADALDAFYLSSRIVVLPSVCFEGFPSSVAEAMLHAKPVICSRIGGLPEIVDDGVTGLLAEPGSAGDLASKVRRLWSDHDLCRRMGEAGREKARKQYSPARYYERLMAAYERALALGPGGGRCRASGLRYAPQARSGSERAAGSLAPGASIAGTRFDLVDCEQAMEAIESWRRNGRRGFVAIVNPHSVMTARRDALMREAISRAGLVLPDGVGIVLAAGILGHAHEGRVAGPTLMLKLCDSGRRHGYRHYFYGGRDGVAEGLAERLCRRFPGMCVAGTYAPPFRGLTPEEDAALIETINAASPDIVWAGLGAPKQEKWMAAHVGRIEATAMIGVGAAFDFHSGRVRWTPRWARIAGLEWAFRLLQDPRRMWRRNLDSPAFLLAALRQRFFGHDADRPRARGRS